MASLSFGTNDDLTVKRWGRDTDRETLPGTVLRLLVGKNKASSPFQMKTELVKQRGDRIRIPYLFASNQLPIKGVSIDGNEAIPDYTSYDVLVNKESYAERREIDLADQRTELSFREDMKYLLSTRAKESMEIQVLNHLGGNSLGTDHAGNTGFDANNTITEPDTDYHLFSGAGTSDSTLVAGDILSSDDIKRAATRAEVLRTQFSRPIIRRANLGKKSPMWGLIMPPRQRDHLIDETSTAGHFFDVQRAAMEGGETSDSQTVLRGRYVDTMYQYIGAYAGVCLYVDPYTPFGNDGASPLTLVDRSIFFGAECGSIAFGKLSPGLERFQWKEEIFRYGEEYGVAIKLMWGAVKATADSIDLGCIVISSHANAV